VNRWLLLPESLFQLIVFLKKKRGEFHEKDWEVEVS
jgi:hypothetical protein